MRTPTVGAGFHARPASVNGQRRRTGDGAPYGARCSVQQQIHVVRHPAEGASGTPPPTVAAIECVSAEPWSFGLFSLSAAEADAEQQGQAEGGEGPGDGGQRFKAEGLDQSGVA